MVSTRRRLSIFLGIAVLAAGFGIYFLLRDIGITTPREPAIAWRANWDISRFHAFSSSTLINAGFLHSQLAGDTLLVVGRDLRLHALDPATGVERWSYGSPGTAIVRTYLDGARLLIHVAVPDPAHK